MEGDTIMSEEDWGELERAAQTGRPAHARGQSGLDLWLSLEGRIPRSTYWLKFALPLAAIQWVGMLVDTVGLGYGPDHLGPGRVIASLLTFWPGIVAAVKRLHDLGHPGWYVAAFYGGTIGAGIALAIAVPLFGAIGGLVAIPLGLLMLGALWYSIKIMFFRGTFGPNEYGPDPLL
jgi:uncharacterized membrane protein YhaH (DUF805 family)